MAVSDSQVKAVIDTARDTTPFITNATTFTTQVLSGKGLSSDMIDLITLYLAAHFVCLTEESGGLKRSRMGEADETYRIPGDKDTGLAFTRYGQQAMILDTTGTLAAISTNKGLKALFNIVGTPGDRINPDPVA